MNFLKVVIAFIAGVLITVIVLKLSAPGMVITERQSPFDFDATVKRIIKQSETEGWEILKVYDMRKSIKKEGLEDIDRIKVIKVYKPRYAFGLLRKDKGKCVGALLPCGFAVFEKTDKKTYVASMNVEMIGNIFGGNIKHAMSQIADENKIILEFLY